MGLAYSPLPPFRAADDAIADAVGPMLNYIGTIAFDLGASIQRPPQAKPQPEPEPKRDELSSLLAMDQDERRAWLHHQRANLAASKQLLAMTQDERREFIARVAEQNSDIHYRTHLGEQPERADSMLDPDSVVLYTQPLERPPMRATRADAVHHAVRLNGATHGRAAARHQPSYDDKALGDVDESSASDARYNFEAAVASSLLDTDSGPQYATQFTDDGLRDDQQWGGWNLWLKRNLLFERKVMAYAVGEVVENLERKHTRKIEALSLRIAELSGEVKVLRALAAARNSAVEARPLDLPDWRRNRDAA
jgi:hypothetical protein